MRLLESSRRFDAGVLSDRSKKFPPRKKAGKHTADHPPSLFVVSEVEPAERACPELAEGFFMDFIIDCYSISIITSFLFSHGAVNGAL